MALIAEEPNESGATRIERDHFVLNVPFEWKSVQSDEPLEFEFRNQTLPEQLIVSILLPNSPLSQEGLRSVVERLVGARLHALRELSKGNAVVSPVAYRSASDELEARGIGYDELNNARFAWVIRATRAKVVTVALTRYSFPESGTPFEAYVGIVFDLLQVKN